MADWTSGYDLPMGDSYFWDPSWDQYFEDVDFNDPNAPAMGDWFGDQTSWLDGITGPIGSLSSLLFGSGGLSSLVGNGGLAGLLTSPLAGLLGGAALGGMGEKGTEWHTTPGLPGAMNEYSKTLSGDYLNVNNPVYKNIMDDALNQWNNAYIPGLMSNTYAKDQTGPLQSRSAFGQNVYQGERAFGKNMANQLSANMFNPERTRMSGAMMQGLPQTYSTNPYAGMLGGGLSGLTAMKLLNDLNKG